MARILIIDDDLAMRSVIRRALQRTGHETLEAGNGQQAADFLKNETVDLVLTDIIMPEMEGVELIQALRRTQPDLKIIAMSGGGRVGPGSYLRLAQAAGAAKVLQKPFEIEELLAAITSLVDGSPSP